MPDHFYNFCLCVLLESTAGCRWWYMLLTEEVWSFLTQWMLTPYSVYRGPRVFQDCLTMAMGYSMHTSRVILCNQIIYSECTGTPALVGGAQPLVAGVRTPMCPPLSWLHHWTCNEIKGSYDNHYHHTTKLYQKKSLICCCWRCYSCCALLTIQTATNSFASY